MIIGIDIRVLGTEQKSGVQEYTENLLAAMLPLDSNIQYKLLYSSYRVPLRPYPWLSLANVTVKKFRIPNRLLLYSSRFLDQPKIDRLMGGVDVFFSPHFLITALSGTVRRVTTFHDLSFEQFPEFFSRKQWWWHRFVAPGWQARFSDRIIAVSESTKHDLVRRYHVDPARVVPILSGVASQFTPLAPEAVERFRAMHQLPQEFILYLGTFEPRKNIVGLIKAFELVKQMPGNEGLALVIAGAKGWLYDEVYAAVAASPFARQIHIRDSVRDEDRPLYYNAARAFAYPSFFEGFGFPPLEAMACGTPVAASSTSSLPEVVADAGLLVNPYNISELANALQTVVHDASLHQRLIERGLARARQLTWSQTAEKTLEILTGL